MNKFKSFFTYSGSLKIRVVPLIITGIFIGSIYLNIRQNKIIKIYKVKYAFFDSVATDAIRTSDSLWILIKELDQKGVVIDYIEGSLLSEYNKLINDPEQFALDFLNVNEPNLGGGD